MNHKCLLLIINLIAFLTGCKDETPFEPVLVVAQSKLPVFASDGGQTSVSITANLEWTATPSGEWIGISPSGGNAQTKSVNIVAAINEDYDGREGYVIFRNSEYSLADTVYVEQVQKDAILVAKDNYEMSSDGGELSFEISSNVNYTVSVNQSWVQQNKSRALAQKTLHFDVAANAQYKERTALITIKSSTVTQTITVVQPGYDDTVERNALIALYNATNGDNWTNHENWCTDKPLYEWYGVSVNQNNRVYWLSLNNNQLNGSIPCELCNLTNLEYLSLYSNQLSGNIPSELGNLTNLKYLYLNGNQLTGSIPAELGSLTNLESLYLSDNQISGSIPSELGNLTNLESLYLSYNQLTGEMPEFIGNMKSYKYVQIYANLLEGEPPTKVTEHADWHIYWPRLVFGTKVNLTETDINAPEFTVKDMDGNTIKSDELYENNTITILYKWGKWCGYSLQYNETLKKIYEQYHKKGLEILGSYSIGSETENEIKTYINENIPWPNHFIVYRNEAAGTEPNYITQLGLIGTVPEIIVVDSNKKVIFQGYTESRFDLPLILAEYF